MEICFKCQAPETKVLLFDVILPEGIDKICGNCSSSVDSPIIRQGIFLDGKTEKKQTVRDRLSKISGVNLEERKLNHVKKDDGLKQIVNRNFAEKLESNVNLNEELIDNFHWILMRARRMKHLTHGQLAEEIREPEEAIKAIELGKVPTKKDIVRKLEQFLNIRIMKNAEPSLQEKNLGQRDSIKLKEESDLDIKNTDNLTISDLQNMKNKITKTTVAVSGYFDPLHIGHIEYFEEAKKLGDILIVILNNDYQARLKNSFMPQEERAKIIKSLRMVDKVFISVDEDKSVCKSLELIKPDIFAKGGDRYSYEIPETEICRKLGIKIVDGLGKKIQSSSGLLKQHGLK